MTQETVVCQEEVLQVCNPLTTYRLLSCICRNNEMINYSYENSYCSLINLKNILGKLRENNKRANSRKLFSRIVLLQPKRSVSCTTKKVIDCTTKAIGHLTEGDLQNLQYVQCVLKSIKKCCYMVLVYRVSFCFKHPNIQ